MNIPQAKPRMIKAIKELDRLNAMDPESDVSDGKEIPKSLLYSQRMTECLNQFLPDAKEGLQLAVRAQHLQRWKIPRNHYPKTKAGYKNWRTDLAKMHARTAGDVLASVGYPMAEIFVIQDIILKRNFKITPDAQALEDVACLVFLKYYLEDFSETVSEEKLISIIKKTWAKMSDKGHEEALKINFSDKIQAVLKKVF